MEERTGRSIFFRTLPATARGPKVPVTMGRFGLRSSWLGLRLGNFCFMQEVRFSNPLMASRIYDPYLNLDQNFSQVSNLVWSWSITGYIAVIPAVWELYKPILHLLLERWNVVCYIKSSWLLLCYLLKSQYSRGGLGKVADWGNFQ